MNEMLKAYLDNELNAEDRALVEKALAENPALQNELDELQALSEAIEMGASSVEIVGLESTLAALGKKRKSFVWWRSPFVAVAAMTCVIAFVMTIPNGMVASEAAADSTVAKSESLNSATPSDGFAPASESPGEESGYTIAGARKGQVESARQQPNATRTSEELWDEESADSQDAKTKALFGAEEANSVRLTPGTSNTVPPGTPRLIIKNGDIQILVKNLESTYQSVETLAKTNGGFVESGGKSNSNQSKYGNLTIRVDSTKFDRTMQSLRTYGDVQSENVSGEDVTAAVADAEARLKQMRLEEKQYQEVLKQAKKVSEILEVKRYISEIRQQIEGTEAQIKALRGMATLSKINVTLEERLKVKSAPRQDWLPNAWIRAINRFTGITRTLVSFALNVVVLAPFWLPVVIGVWIWRKRAVRK